MESSWKSAKIKGDVRYFTGKPCRKGHVSERITSNRHCLACHAIHAAKYFAKRYVTDKEFSKKHRERSDKWKAQNPNRKRAHNKKWRNNNPDKVSENNRRWRKANPEGAYQNSKRWRENNREKARQCCRDWEARNPEQATLLKRACHINRRSREIAGGYKLRKSDILAVFSKFKNRCAKCGSIAKIEIDHIQPFALGGTHHPSNLQLLCKPCNRAKSDKDPMKWAAEHNLSLGLPFSG